MDELFALLSKYGINSRLWLAEYLAASEACGGKAPPDFEKYLPWNLAPELKERLSKDYNFSYGKANFVQKNDGTVFHIHADGSMTRMDIGDLTWAEFQELTGLD